MDYHKSPEPLRLREYGRLIQNMAEHVLRQPDKAHRTAMAYEVVRVMHTLFPQGREMQDYKRKLWDHLHRMTGYQLDIDGPYPKPEPPAPEARPPRASYYSYTTKFRQYGKNIELMVEKATNMPAGPAKDIYIRQIASYMRLLLSLRNQIKGPDANQDQVVYDHLRAISKGMIDIRPEGPLLGTSLKDHPRNRVSNASSPVYHRKRKVTAAQAVQKIAQKLKNRKKFRRQGGR
jgi:hypothetical protein